jgi:hypothetical protein
LAGESIARNIGIFAASKSNNVAPQQCRKRIA